MMDSVLHIMSLKTLFPHTSPFPLIDPAEDEVYLLEVLTDVLAAASYQRTVYLDGP